MKKKKILFVVSNLKVGGGAEKSVSLISSGISKYYDVELLTFYDFDNEYPYDVKRHSFGFKYRQNIFAKGFRFLFIFPFLLRKFLKKNRYDLVVSNAEDANLVSLITKKFFYNFKLWTVIRNNIFDKKNVYYRFSFLQKYSDKIIVLTKALQSKCPFDSVVLENALDFNEIQIKRKEKIPREEQTLFNKKTILMIGRLSEQKNHLWFFEIFKKLKDVNLIIIGNGPLEKKLKQKAYKNIYFLGTKNNVYKYLNKCDVFVLPSLYEGMPRVLMEALACGCVCVANDCETGPRELLGVELTKELKRYKQTKYGYLVPFNNKGEFVKALNDALKHGKKIQPDTRFELENITKKWTREINNHFGEK